MKARTSTALHVVSWLIAATLAVFLALHLRPLWNPLFVKAGGGKTVSDVLAAVGDESRSTLSRRFKAAGLRYPPREVALLALKEERVLEVWGAGGEGEWAYVTSYPILAASGGPGPKLKEGDRQVPEGVYRVIGLNPNSICHLSLALDYPNAFDRLHAEEDGRSDPGGDIFIHGSDVSVGCLAMGDEAIEDIFVLAADVGVDDFTVLLAPRDPRGRPLPRELERGPDWLPELYDLLEAEFEAFTAR